MKAAWYSPRQAHGMHHPGSWATRASAIRRHSAAARSAGTSLRRPASSARASSR